jgi:hypothetical protein
MGTSASSQIAVNLNDLENLIRRVVRKELIRARRQPSILDDWSQEEPDDSAGDEQVLREALPVLEQYHAGRAGWKTLEEIESESTDSPSAL